ncbi:uncharacterized protein LOC132192470 isoform X2 [Neocloeon triangulifer]|nr:uncharacterized protein LOC132192470 isoform X2 [Neocloeon triangulifer]
MSLPTTEARPDVNYVETESSTSVGNGAQDYSNEVLTTIVDHNSVTTELSSSVMDPRSTSADILGIFAESTQTTIASSTETHTTSQSLSTATKTAPINASTLKNLSSSTAKIVATTIITTTSTTAKPTTTSIRHTGPTTKWTSTQSTGKVTPPTIYQPPPVAPTSQAKSLPTPRPPCEAPICRFNSNCTQNYEDSYLTCCGLGMKLISFHHSLAYEQVSQAFKQGNFSKWDSSKFWTSGTDNGCENAFGFCGSNTLLRDDTKWATGEPNNSNGTEHCISVELKNNSLLLFDDNCNLRQRYICEGRVVSPLLATSIEEDCRLMFSLTKEDIKRVMTEGPRDLQEKCFFKCFGENSGLYVNGKLSEEKLYAAFSEIAPENLTALIAMYNTMDYCSNMTRGMDLCDKAAELKACGDQAAPEAMAKLMDHLEKTMADPPILLPTGKAYCPTDFNCYIDGTLKTVFDAAPNDSYFSFSDGFGYVKHACGKKFLHLSYKYEVNITGALEKCCLFGLRSVIIPTAEKYDCIISSNLVGNTTNTLVMTAASRLGYPTRPVWCFTGDALMNLTIAPNNLSLPIGSRYSVQFKLMEKEMGGYYDSIPEVLCESY